jgi:hypothetical protein
MFSRYLAELSMCIAGKRKKEKIFYRVVYQLFEELENPRVLGLFIALLKLIIQKEIETAKVMDEVLHPKTSRAFHLFSQFARHPFFYGVVVHPIMDVSRKAADVAKTPWGSSGASLVGKENAVDVAKTPWGSSGANLVCKLI